MVQNNINPLNNHWKDDLIAGFIVFLIALPLSIGIALAAGAPASAGILSAIIGGIIGTLITGTHVAINGPAAGMIVVIGGSILSLSEGGDLLLGFKRTLAATIIAGILQILTGVLRFGKFTFLAPLSVVRGMLAAIGTIIMIKQIPVLLGVENSSKTILGLLREIPELVEQTHLPVFTIALIGLIILIVWKYVPKQVSQIIPGSLVAVASGLAFSFIFKMHQNQSIVWLNSAYEVGPNFLVQVPTSIKELIILPTFDIIFSSKSLVSIITIFLVGSLESLLSAYAVDKLDPYKRKSDLDFDIIGKGITNITCGLLGAYPVISEIVRSSANITNGAKTKWSNFFHGFYILVFVAFLPEILNLIPLASLAAILFLIGFNLVHPRTLIEIYRTGKEQLFYFSVTLIVTVVEDLLLGIALGILLKVLNLVFIKKVPFKNLFSPSFEIQKQDEKVVINFNGPITFLGYLKLNSQINQLEKQLEVEIFENNHFIDFTIRETLKELKK